MGAEGEVVDRGTLTAEIEDADLWVWNTTVVSGFRIWLVLAVTVAASRSAAHCK